jgi:hypothetical protein
LGDTLYGVPVFTSAQLEDRDREEIEIVNEKSTFSVLDSGRFDCIEI